MAKEREKELERRFKRGREDCRRKPVVATVPKEGMASPSLTVVSLPCIGLSTSLSEPQFLHHKMERLHRMREDIHNT